MDNQDLNLKQFIIPAIIIILIIGGFLYWQKNNKKDNDVVSTTTISSGEIAGVSLEDTNNYQTPNSVKNQNVVNDSNTYQAALSKIRQPVNEAIYDLIDKNKYRNKYSKDDVLAAAKIARKNCQEGKKKIEELKIDAKFKAYNQKHLQSVQYLLEAIDALEQLYETGESKYADEFSLKIDYSNREINNLNIHQ